MEFFRGAAYVLVFIGFLFVLKWGYSREVDEILDEGGVRATVTVSALGFATLACLVGLLMLIP